MINTEDFISSIKGVFHDSFSHQPWIGIGKIADLLTEKLGSLPTDFTIKNGVAIHKTATVEQGVILKGPVIIEENCFIGANAYLRGGVYLGKNSMIGTSCEVKSSIIMNNSGIAHFNFIGNSLIGSFVNFEAGAITANHFNEREEKEILLYYNSRIINTGVSKFGALVGDFSKIGANAVLSPGTLLSPKTIVKRLELVDQSSAAK